MPPPQPQPRKTSMTHKPLMRAATGLVLFAASVAAQADLLSSSTDGGWGDSVAFTASDPFAASTVSTANKSITATASLTAGSAPLALPTGGPVSLWSFITSVRAQQRGDTFSVLETNLSLVGMADALPPAQVPLPAAAWCLLMGLLGMAGVRLTGQGTQRSQREIAGVSPPPLPA